MAPPKSGPKAIFFHPLGFCSNLGYRGLPLEGAGPWRLDQVPGPLDALGPQHVAVGAPRDGAVTAPNEDLVGAKNVPRAWHADGAP